jgi:hypothetical protein
MPDFSGRAAGKLRPDELVVALLVDGLGLHQRWRRGRLFLLLILTQRSEKVDMVYLFDFRKRRQCFQEVAL